MGKHTNSFTWIRNPIYQYQLVRWYWQGFSTVEIADAIDGGKNHIITIIRKFTPTNRKGSRKKDDPAHKQEILLNRILKKYGPEVYKMWIDYPNNPNLDYAIIAENMGISYEAVRKRMTILYGYRTEPNASKGVSKTKGRINTKDKISSQILLEHGPAIHKIVMNYNNDPMTTITDIAELLGISKTSASTKLKILHGSCLYNKPMIHKYCECSQK